MKTLSYVKAVKKAVAEAEKFNDDWWLDKWRRHMTVLPRITMCREI
jgi:hypothetical protein